MCTTCSECVADVYVGVKTHLCNIHTRPCTSAHNTCKVHVTLIVKKIKIYTCIYIYIQTHDYTCNIYVYVYAYVYIYVQVDLHTYVHVYTYVIHKCMYV